MEKMAMDAKKSINCTGANLLDVSVKSRHWNKRHC